MVEDALQKYHWNKQEAAQEHGLSRHRLIENLKRLGSSNISNQQRDKHLIDCWALQYGTLSYES